MLSLICIDLELTSVDNVALSNHSSVIEGNGYEAWHSYLLYSFVSCFVGGLVSQYNI